MVGCAAMFPAFARAWSEHHGAENAVITNKAPMDEVLAQNKAELAADAALLAALTKNDRDFKYVDMLRALVSARRDVTIASFALNEVDQKTFSVAMNGEAPTRSSLLSFKSRLEAKFPGTTVDIPIDQLAKSSRLPFALRFTVKMP